MSRTLIASDWHLGSRSPPQHGHMARTFLQRAYADGDTVILNGDIFEGLFEPIEQAQEAQSAVMQALDQLTQAGRLVRIAGNHDPTFGVIKHILDVPQVGRVLIAHGHTVDPLQRSPIGRLGDLMSRNLGHFKVIRGAAHLAEKTSLALAGKQMLHIFRQRCLAFVTREKCDLGIFGHVHHRFYDAASRYANAGWMSAKKLEYMILADQGPTLATLTYAEMT